jgi:hypothetical protein
MLRALSRASPTARCFAQSQAACSHRAPPHLSLFIRARAAADRDATNCSNGASSDGGARDGGHLRPQSAVPTHFTRLPSSPSAHAKSAASASSPSAAIPDSCDPNLPAFATSPSLRHAASSDNRDQRERLEWLPSPGTYSQKYST